MTSYKPMSDKPSVRSPWFWVPSLYFAQGIPYVAVMIVSVLMYKRLGVSNTDIALYTSWLNLPWVIRAISEIKGIPEETVEAVTWENAIALYRMNDV